MRLYLDIDGVLLNYDSDTRTDYSIELIDYITNEFDCYWLTTHCKGDVNPAIEYLSDYFPEDTIKKLQKIKPTYWDLILMPVQSSSTTALQEQPLV